MLDQRDLKNLFTAAVIAIALSVVCVGNARAGGDWNDSAIQWRGYENGLAEAAKSGKPICMIFYTDWCPHCTKYSGVFHDEKVIEKAKSFVMIRLNKDQNKELSGKHAPDGEYIPRTFFLSSKGKMKSVKAPRDKYQYFYNPQASGELLAAMDTALKTN